ncbi:MAG: hypothetical protein KDC92_04105 [Bacteroidetes bacterium]|nr:hypothetical protein [Bacteroidota bacterium]
MLATFAQFYFMLSLTEFHQLVNLPLKWIDGKTEFMKLGVLTNDLVFKVQQTSPWMFRVHLPSEPNRKLRAPSLEMAIDGTTEYVLDHWQAIWQFQLEKQKINPSITNYALTIAQIEELMALTDTHVEQAFVLKKNGEV